MFKWIKNLFTKNPKKDPHLELYEDLDYSKLSKGDLKKLKDKGIIKSIYKPYI
jgi:uridylate kinase